MKKTRLWLAALLVVTVLAFTGCGSDDDNHDGIPDDQQNRTEQDVEDGADDLMDGAEDLGDDLKDGVEDAADGVEDALDGDDNDHDNAGNQAGTASNVE